MNPPPGRVMRDETAAKRFHEQLTLHHLGLTRDELVAGRFMAVRLSDGGSDGHAYETSQEAMKFQIGTVMPFKIPLERLAVAACDALLWYFRRVHAAGWRPSADDPRELFVPNRIEDIR